MRPTSDRTREALFNILEHGDYLEDSGLDGLKVLDLFAGSGALGLEALSRGAAYVLFVEDAVPSRAAIRRNIETLNETGATKIYRRDATHLGPIAPTARGPFNLVFADPPYGKNLGEAALASAAEGGWLVAGALCVLEEATRATITIPDGFAELGRREYGDTRITFLRYVKAGSGKVDTRQK